MSFFNDLLINFSNILRDCFCVTQKNNNWQRSTIRYTIGCSHTSRSWASEDVQRKSFWSCAKKQPSTGKRFKLTSAICPSCGSHFGNWCVFWIEMVFLLPLMKLFLISLIDRIQDKQALKIIIKTPTKTSTAATTPPPEHAAVTTTPPPEHAAATTPPPEHAAATTSSKKKTGRTQSKLVKATTSSKHTTATTPPTEQLMKIQKFHGFKFGEDEKMKVLVVSLFQNLFTVVIWFCLMFNSNSNFRCTSLVPSGWILQHSRLNPMSRSSWRTKSRWWRHWTTW